VNYVFTCLLCYFYVPQGVQVAPTLCWRSIFMKKYGDCNGMIVRAVAGESSITFVTFSLCSFGVVANWECFTWWFVSCWLCCGRIRFHWKEGCGADKVTFTRISTWASRLCNGYCCIGNCTAWFQVHTCHSCCASWCCTWQGNPVHTVCWHILCWPVVGYNLLLEFPLLWWSSQMLCEK